MISTDAITRVKYALKNSVMILVWLTIFFGATSVNLTETEQLIATIVFTESPRAKFILPNTEEGMMVRCDLSSNGLLGHYFFDETVTSSTYRKMIVDYAWPQLQHKRFYFQYDAAAPHYSVIVRGWLDEKFSGGWIGRHGPFDWPAPSPDLTPCDFFL